MAWCLTKDQSTEFKKALVNGEIDPFKLAEMSSAERNALFSKVVSSENAQQINALFESKLLLKNQVKGFETWAKKVSGITPQARRDMLAKIERLDKVLSPAEGEQFLQDLASTRLGIGITEAEAKRISDLSQKVTDLKTKTDVTKSDIALGRAKLDVLDYVNSLSGKKANLLVNVAGVPRTVLTSIDLSAPLNQGWGMVSRKRFYTSLGTMFKSAASKGSFRDLQAEIITHPKYDLAKKAGLRLTDLGDKLEMREEQFMSTLLDRVPGIAASQRAYTAFLNKIRIDSFNDFVNKAEVAGENISLGSKTVEDLAKVVNDLTGGARLGKLEGATSISNVFLFSLRKNVSILNLMNPVNYVNPNISKTARLERTRSVIGSLALSAGVIALYALLTGKKQEADPTSSDFGRIRSGDTRLEVGGGSATYINILSRLILGRIKRQSGVSQKLGTGYGETSGWDLLGQFVRYKLSPNASLLVDAIVGENAIGEKKTVTQSVIDRFKPMFLESLVELLKSDTDGKFGFAVGGLFGAGLNTYSQATDWDKSETLELKQFKEKVGDEKFKDANGEFNQTYDNWFNDVSNKDEYKNLSDDSKANLQTQAKSKIKDEIFKEYRFKYKAPIKTQDQKKESDQLKKLLPDKISATKPKDILAGLVDGIGGVLTAFSTVASAKESEKNLINVLYNEVNNTVKFIYEEKGNYTAEVKSINEMYKNEGFWSEIGKRFHNIGTKYQLPELNISEAFKYKNPQQKIQAFKEDFNQFLDHASGKIPPSSSILEPTPTTEDKVVEAERSTGPGVATKTKYNNTIKDVFGGDWIDATRVLSRKLPDGKIVGENNDLFGTPEEDPAKQNTDRTNPNGTIDRGLFRINSFTFSDLQSRSFWKNRMAKDGITTYEDMLDPIKNIKMAKIIFDERKYNKGSSGWDPWVAAPKDLLSEKEINRRINEDVPILSRLNVNNSNV